MPGEEEKWTCELCESVCENKKGKYCECEYCNHHFCTKCLNMKDADYNHLSKSPGMWFCPPCDLKVKKVLLENKTIEEKCGEFLKDFENRIESLEHKITEKCDVHKVKEIVANEIKNQNVAFATNQVNTENTADILTEIRDSKARENNVIIYQLQEPTAILKTDRVNHDKDKLNELMEKLGNGINIDEDIDNGRLLRIGRRDESKTRPLLVSFKHLEAKVKFMKSLTKLKSLEENDRLNKISVVHDMTKQEREHEVKLVTEMKEKNRDSGDWIFKIRGPPGTRKLVQIKKN